MSTTKQFARNVLVNWINTLTSIVVVFFLSPYVVRTLGDTFYGIWVLINELTNYYSSVDIGLRPAIGQYITRYVASKENEKLRDTIATSFAALWVVFFVVVLISLVMVWLFPVFFNVKPEAVMVTRIAVGVAGMSVALRFPIATLGSIITAFHRYDIMSGFTAVMTVLRAIAIYLVLRAGQGIVGLSIVIGCFTLVEGVCKYLFSRMLLKGVAISFWGFNRAIFDKLKSYGIYSFFGEISRHIILYTDNLVIGFFLNPVAVTYYAVGGNVIPHIAKIISSIGMPLSKIAISHDAQGNEHFLRDLSLKGTRYLFAFATAMSAALFVGGPAFLGQWIGEKYLLGEPYSSSGDILRILVTANLGAYSCVAVIQVLYAKRLVKRFAVFTGIEALLNIVFSVIFVKFFGIVGVAFGTLIPMLFVRGVLIPANVCSYITVSYWRYLRYAIVPNWINYGVTIVTSIAVLRHVTFNGWPGVLFGLGLPFVFSVVLSVLFVVEKKEKKGVVDLLQKKFRP